MKSFKKTMAVAAMSVAVTSAFAAGGPGVEHRSQKFLEALEAHGGTPIEQMQPADARNVLVGAQASVKLQLPKAQVSERTIEQDGQKVRLTIVRPANAKGKTAAFVFVHGGGWILGDYPTHERLVRDLVSSSGATAVFVNYSPSPEARYPVAINEIYAATKWVAQHGDQIGVDGSRLAVAGNSVGGNMAAAISQMAKDKDGPKIRFQLLMWPVTDANFETAYKQFEKGYFLSTSMMHWFWNAYTTNPAERKEIYASPLQASVEQLRGLPPTLIQTAEMDVLRDEAEAYGRKLDQAQVDVTTIRYNGMIHDFGLLNVLHDVPGSRIAIRQAGEELKAHLK
jgi:acetyl esterase